MSSFKELLNSLTVDQLKQRLVLLDAPERPKRKAEIIALIRRHMLSERCRDYCQQLQDLEQNAVSEAVHRWAGCFKAVRFNAKYGALPDYFDQKSIIITSGYSSSSKRSERSHLVLFFYNGIVPEELCKHLQTFIPKPLSNALSFVEESDIPQYWEVEGPKWDTGKDHQFPVKVLSTELIVAHDLRAMLRLIESTPVAVSDKTGLASAAALRKIEEILMGGDFYTQEEDWGLEKFEGGLLRSIRPFAWPLLLQSGGLAKRDGRKLSLTRKGKKALGASVSDTIRDLYTGWRDKGMLDEFRRVDVIKGQSGKGRRMTAVAGRRAVIEDALRECPVGHWLNIDTFLRYIQAEGIDFEVVHDPWKLYISDNQYGLLGYQGFHGFHILQARYILVYLFEYLATLGMIDIAYSLPYRVRFDYKDNWGTDELVFLSRYDGLLYFRLNPLGAYCLGLVEEYYPSRSKVTPLLKLAEDLHITLIRQAEPSERLLLEQNAQAISDNEWQLTQETILKAIEKGHDLSVFRQFLLDHAEQSLPEAVERFFEIAQQRCSAIGDGGTARLLVCGNVALAKMIATDPATKKYCLHAGGRTLAIPEKVEKSFRKGLRKLGYVF